MLMFWTCLLWFLHGLCWLFRQVPAGLEVAIFLFPTKDTYRGYSCCHTVSREQPSGYQRRSHTDTDGMWTPSSYWPLGWALLHTEARPTVTDTSRVPALLTSHCTKPHADPDTKPAVRLLTAVCAMLQAHRTDKCSSGGADRYQSNLQDRNLLTSSQPQWPSVIWRSQLTVAVFTQEPVVQIPLTLSSGPAATDRVTAWNALKAALSAKVMRACVFPVSNKRCGWGTLMFFKVKLHVMFPQRDIVHLYGTNG